MTTLNPKSLSLTESPVNNKSHKANSHAADLEAQWTSLGNRREICKTRVLSLMAEGFRCLRTGAEHDFITFNCMNWVNVIAETNDNCLVMIRQFRHGSRKVEWEIPGGCIDLSDPDPASAGARELLEETGYTGKSARIIGSVCPNPALQGNICYTVKIDGAACSGEPQMEATEAIETVILPESDIMDMIRGGDIRHGLVLNALMFHFLDKNKAMNTEKKQ